jgi:anti-anti-sigma factor
MPLDIDRLDVPRSLRLAGELDVAAAPAIASFLEAEGQGDGDLTLDVSELSFVDSSGVRALIRAADSLAGRGRLILRTPTTTVLRVLDLMGLVGATPHLVVDRAPRQAGNEETRSFLADSSSLADIRTFIRDRALADGYGEWADSVVLAVSEACSNAILHSGSHEVTVTWRVLPERAEVEIRDTGIFRRAIPPDRAGTNSRGILLMMSMMDQITITCGTDARPGTVVRMVKMKNGRQAGSGRRQEAGATGRFLPGGSRVAS